MRDLMKQDDDRTSAVPGIQNVSDIGTRRLSKPRLYRRIDGLLQHVIFEW